MRVLVCGIAVAALTVQAGTNVYVSATGTYEDAKGVHAAWTDLQDAINAAAEGDTVLVENGYEWNPGVARHTDTDAKIGGRVLGIPKKMTVRSRSGEWGTGATIRGRWHSEDTPVGANALAGVRLPKGATLMGFKVLDCAVTSSTQQGAGIYGTADCYVKKCFVANCRAGVGAASIAVEFSDCVVSNCAATTRATFGTSGASNTLFIDNDCPNSGMYHFWGAHGQVNCTYVRNTGGGTLCDNGGAASYPVKVTGCVFSNNTAVCVGAKWNTKTAVTVSDCIFVANTGSAIYADHSGSVNYLGNTVTAYNCIITNNAASADGHPIVELPGSYYNCLIADNVGTGLGNRTDGLGTTSLYGVTIVNNVSDSAAAITGAAYVEAYNSVIYGNVGAEGKTSMLGRADHCVLDIDAAIATGCENADPFLVSPAKGLYQPCDFSPCRGRGNLECPRSDVDLAGLPRLTDGVLDIGAYQYDASVRHIEATMSVATKFVYAPAQVSFSAKTCGLGRDGVTFYWDFDDDGTVDFVTTAPMFVHTLAAGTYKPHLCVSNATEGLDYRFTDSLVVGTRPVRYVKAGNAGEAYPYASEATAAADIQTALDICRGGDEVVILPGTYALTNAVCVTNEVIVRGATGRPEDVVLRQTESDRCLQIVGGAQCIVHSLTVESGLRDGNWQYASGVFMAEGNGDEVTAGSGTLSNVVVRNCSQSSKWGVCAGVYAKGLDCFVTHCTITNNHSSASSADGGYVQGVALQVEDGARAENCLVAFNRTDNNNLPWSADLWTGWHGGLRQAAVLVGDNSTLRYSTVVSNAMSFCGGVNVSGSGAFTKCVIAGNAVLCKNVCECSDRYRVWAAYKDGRDSTIFYSNVSQQDFRQNFINFMDKEVVLASDATRVARLVTNAIDVDCLPSENGTIVTDATALFRRFPRDFRLCNDSPAVDIVPEGEESKMASGDLRGNPRCVNGAYDLGCYEKPKTPGLVIMVR